MSGTPGSDCCSSPAEVDETARLAARNERANQWRLKD